ncbi:MAG: sugar ABC transporter substrate-binding protein [Chloroflexota bacterium]
MGQVTRGGGWSRRRFLAGGAASATLALLSVCAGGASALPAPAGAAAAEPPIQPDVSRRPDVLDVPQSASLQTVPAQVNNPVLLSWMAPADVGEERDLLITFARRFEAQHPGIKIAMSFERRGDYERRLSAALAGTSAPDLVQLHASIVQEYGLADALRDLFPYLQRRPGGQAVFFPSLIEQMTDFKTRSRLWAVPMDSASYGVFYNKDLFDRAGVPYPEPDWTFGDFREAARRLTQDVHGNPVTSAAFDPTGIAQWGVSWGHPEIDSPLPASDLWQTLAWGQAGPWFSDDLRQAFIDDPAHSDFVQQVVEMRCADGSMPLADQWTDASDPWRKGLVAMSIAQHSQAYFHQREQRAFPFDVVPPPGGPRGQFTAATCNGWAIPAQAPHPDEAWEFINFLVSPEQQSQMAQAKRWGPALKESAPALLPDDGVPDGFKSVFLDPLAGLSTVQVRPILYPPYLDEMREIWKSEFDDLFNCGSGSIGDAAERAQPQIQALLDRAWSA